MKYLCLVHLEDEKLAALTKSEYDALVNERLAYDDELRKSGHYVFSEAFHAARAEAKGQLGGFIAIDAKDLNEAIHIASKIPPGRIGCIEVRPIEELEIRE